MRRRAEAVAARAATRAAQAAAVLASWQAEQHSLDRLAQTAKRLQDGDDVSASMVLTKKGELTVWVGAAALQEARRGATHYEGGSQGVSIPLGHTGVRYRVGAMKGQAVQGPDVDALVDVGMVTLRDNLIVCRRSATSTGGCYFRRRPSKWGASELRGVGTSRTG
jgi:hypothetical protein